MKSKALVTFCILAVLSMLLFYAFSGVMRVNKTYNDSSDSELNNESNKIVDMALADPEVKEKVEFLERRYGKITPEVEGCSGNKYVVRFSLQVDEEKAEKTEKELIFFTHRPHGFSCVVDMDAESVEEIIGWHFEEAMLLDIVLANSEAKSKLEALKERYGDVSIVLVTSACNNMVELRFMPLFNPHEERSEKLYGIVCTLDTEIERVVKIEEFSMP